MPFIKHNRLNFPSLRNLDMTVLKHMTQAIFLTCLGMHHNDCKKPIWQITHKLFIFFNALMSTGSAADLYVFCEKHVYLLRLALIEHFVAFTNKNMQIEVFLMPLMLDQATDSSVKGETQNDAAALGPPWMRFECARSLNKQPARNPDDCTAT